MAGDGIFSRHSHMERFTLMLAVSAVALCCAVVACIVKSAQDSVIVLGDQAVYSTQFKTSRTQTSGTVEGVYASADKTRAFVLLKYDDMSFVSTNAGDYQMLLTSVDANRKNVPLTKAVSGSYYIFGATGYAGVYLVCNEGFDAQILDLVVMNNNELAEVDVNVDTNDANAEFLSMYDAYRIYFNPGAAQAQTVRGLDDAAPDPSDLYIQCVLEPEVDALRDDMQAQLASMKKELALIDEYENRLVSSYGLSRPAAPEYIDGDQVTGTEEDGDLKLVSDHVADDAVPIDWEGRDLADGWMDEVLQDGETKEAYAKRMSSVQNPGIDTSTTQVATWTLKDGTLLIDADTGSTGTSYADCQADCQNLISAWSSYARDKWNLETSMALKFCDVEIRRDNMVGKVSASTGDGALTVY